MIKNIPIEKIHPNNHNPRKDLGNLAELADGTHELYLGD